MCCDLLVLLLSTLQANGPVSTEESSTPPPVVTSAPPPPAPLPAGWTDHKTPSGHTYYYNSATGESSWTRPQPASDSNNKREKDLLDVSDMLMCMHVGYYSATCTCMYYVSIYMYTLYITYSTCTCI